MSRRLHATHSGGCGFWRGFGQHVAGRHRDELARVAGERLLGHAADRDAQAFLPHGALLLGVDHEPAELGLGRRLTGAEVGPAVAHEVEHRDALGDPRGMVERRRRLHDAVTEADVLRALRRGREEHLGRAGVRVLLEEVVLDLPRVLDADAVGVLDLLERVLDQPVLGVLLPRPRQLVLVEDAELHACCSVPSAWNPSRMSARRGLHASACSTSALALRTNSSRFWPSARPSDDVPQRADDFGARDLRARSHRRTCGRASR